MNISLTPQMEKLVKQKVLAGLYHSSQEVIGEALTLLEERDHFRELKMANLRKEIAMGIEQAERGELTPIDFETIQKRGYELLPQQSEENHDGRNS